VKLVLVVLKYYTEGNGEQSVVVIIIIIGIEMKLQLYVVNLVI
jgi:hypothetical protein